MNAPEHREEPRSSVKIALNAKGEAQIEVKVYAGETHADVTAARTNAQMHFEAAMKWSIEKGYRAA